MAESRNDLDGDIGPLGSEQWSEGVGDEQIVLGANQKARRFADVSDVGTEVGVRGLVLLQAV